jgi:hypothetical protein
MYGAASVEEEPDEANTLSGFTREEEIA